MSGGYYGDYATSSVVYMVFDSFAAGTGAPSAVTNFAAADIQIYKNGSATQRSSANGITVTTTFDSLTGLQMVAIDLSDNTDAGFYVAGAEYAVAVSDITIDSQTVRFWLGAFSIERAVKVNVTKWNGTAVATPNTAGYPVVTVKDGTGTGEIDTSSGTVKVGSFSTGAIDAAAIAADAGTEIAAAVWDKDLFAVYTGSGVLAGDYAVDTNTQAGVAASATVAAASGASDSGTTTTMVDAARTESDTDYWKGSIIVFVSGNIVGQSRVITGFNPATDTITFSPAVTQAVSTQQYRIYSQTADQFNVVVENAYSVRDLLRGFASALLGKASGLAGTSPVYRDTADSKNRISATTDSSGNRTAVTLDLS